MLCQLQVLSFWWFWIMLFWRRSLCPTYAIRYIHSWSVSFVNWSLLIIALHPSPLLFSLVSPPYTLSLEISLMVLGCCSSCGKTISLECSSCVIYVHFFWSAAQQPLKIPPPPQKLWWRRLGDCLLSCDCTSFLSSFFIWFGQVSYRIIYEYMQLLNISNVFIEVKLWFY